MEFSEKLFQALKKDNLKEFRHCMENNSCGSLRLGRFPVLTVMYLYNARRILRAYEKSFLRHNSWQDIGEPVELAARFRDVAGKCLRIYLNETVSPVEMLLLLDRNAKLKRVFPQTNMTAPVKQRLKDIYYIKWSLQAEFVGGNIVLQRRPMTRAEKLRWITCTLCVVLCVALAVGTPFVVNAFVPYIADENGVLNVDKWEKINFTSDKIYALKNDVTVTENFFAEEMNCELRGNGHVVKVSGDAVFGNVNGKLTDIVFETNGCAVAENVTFFGVVQQVTVNAVVNKQTDKACAFFVNNNYGTLQQVTVNVSGSLTAISTDGEENSYMCGGIAATNNPSVYVGVEYRAVLQNCVANYDNFSLKGQLQADASFGGLVGKNDGYVQKCQTSGNIFSETLDVAGICSENNYLLSNCTNGANVTQTTDVTGWNPIAAGIVLNNQNTVDACKNIGNVTCKSFSEAVAVDGVLPTAYAAGIAYHNYVKSVTPFLKNCSNSGNITATATEIDVSAAGICNFTNGGTRTCLNNGKVSAQGTNVVVAAGIADVAYGFIENSANSGEISAESDKEVRAGGIVGTSCVQTLNCLSTGSITAKGAVCYVGGISGYSAGVVSGSVLHCGFVEKCVADCTINVTATSLDVSAVGGINGFVIEQAVNDPNTNQIIYAGGQVSSCYFTGKLQTSGDVYVGGIVGVTGKNIYLASAPEDAKTFFYDNMYLDDCGASVAFGKVNSDIGYETVADVGAQIASEKDIAEDETYKAILQFFGII